MIHTSWYNTTLIIRSCIVEWSTASKNGMSLSTSSLSVSHDDPIKSVQDVLYNRKCNLLVCLFLCRLLVKHLIKKEVSLVVIGSDQGNRLVILQNNDEFYIFPLLSRTLRIDAFPSCLHYWALLQEKVWLW